MKNAKPLLGITMGDAAGIGPEVIAKALKDRWVYENVRPFVIGNSSAMVSAIELAGGSGATNLIHDVEDAKGSHGIIQILDTWKSFKDKLDLIKSLLCLLLDT